MRQKTGGRQKGTQNKMTAELKQIVKNIVSNELEFMQINLEKLSPDKRIDLTIKLMQYVLPKITGLTTADDTEKIEVVFVKGKTIL
jgi:hypothetical protein